MESFYIVTEKSSLHTDYIKYLENAKEIQQVYMKFCEKHAIDADSYYAFSHFLYIKPTQQDYDKFSDQFSKSAKDNRCSLEKFKMSSPIGKDWAKTLMEENRVVIHEPYVRAWFNGAALITGFTRQYSHQEFMYDGKLYCCYNAFTKEKPPCPKGFIEIEDIEFHRALEAASNKYNDNI